jgi:putative transposase
MSDEGLRVIYLKKQKRRYSSYQGEISKAPDNLVKRKFHAKSPNELWLTDITEFRLPGDVRKIYLSAVLDCFDGGLASWSIGLSPNAELANTSLTKACATLREGQRPICHSDRGCHYRWDGWTEICKRNGITRSMSKKGCSPDNSACEGLFGRLKNEFFYYRDWTGVSAEEFIERLDRWLSYYNNERIKEPLGWLSPMQYRKSLGLAA